ncbi:uncharacterized protein N7500_007406 [Penicillium coprophilum]|uniref:uncharacterized protein n=1 Tax=Penicillium coprophilum TaxID=36646 RepID=UPI0023A67390|nr:uncharacterized protein N7500_007406 [Penicillium coprophilum]KAJ5165576.1 hypothetical protein N7500_007406 [Penicillium coprophilum]
MAPTTAEHDSDAASLTQQTQRNIPTLPIYLVTLWCLQCFRISLRDWDTALPFEPKCWIDTVASQMCARCHETKSNCESVYRGIRGHVFELMALLEFAKQYWLNEGEGFGQTDVADLVWDYGVIRDISEAVRSLCLSFESLVMAHGEAHILTDNASDDAKAAYSTWCNDREHLTYPETMLITNLAQKYASQATEHLRLRLGEEGQIHWAAAICSFYDAVESAVRSHQERVCATQCDQEIGCSHLMEISTNLDEEFPLPRPEL